jgi:hypothetical protein
MDSAHERDSFGCGDGMPRRRTRRRRAATWVGILMSASIAAIWLWSGWRYIVWMTPGRSAGTAYEVGIGFGVAYATAWRETLGTRRSQLPKRSTVKVEKFWPSPRWESSFNYSSRPAVRGLASDEIRIPLWSPLLLFVISTIAAHYLGRRRGSTQCQACAYDLTGNTTGVCPECGHKDGQRIGSLSGAVTPPTSTRDAPA